MNKRATALDALRGYAIITMVLSATIISGMLPGWMSHAQVPPPDHVFNPDLPGITWVDMVFPSFLFALGAALPFSVGRRIEKGLSKLSLAIQALWRGLKLAFFAILIQHFYPYVLSSPQDMRSWLLALFCFALLFPMFMRLPWKMSSWARTAIQLAAMAVGTVVMVNLHYANGEPFSLYDSNIIILILSNVAAAATLLYIFTINRPFVLLGALGLLAGLFIASDSAPDSWQHTLMTYSPARWLYNPNFLRYLLLVMPGCYAGELLAGWMKSRSDAQPDDNGPVRTKAPVLLALVLFIVISNLYFLYTRMLLTNLVCSLCAIAAGYYMLRNGEGYAALWRKLFVLGAYMLVLGLCWESFEGGIKKDPVTFSYLFATAGLSTFIMIFFSIVCDYYGCHRATAFLVLPGQNPMMAYVATSLFVFPILNITGLADYLTIFTHSSAGAFLQGLVLTSLAVVVTMFFTRLKCVWRT